jgi:hypothetical protein|tara:strand:+ start:82 stop:249 length:168 start_codon:yes stop_codon:yes gene_type:complete
MGKQNKELFDNIEKFDSNDYQGRSKQQVEGNELMSAVSVMGLIAIAIIMSVISYL